MIFSRDKSDQVRADYKAQIKELKKAYDSAVFVLQRQVEQMHKAMLAKDDVLQKLTEMVAKMQEAGRTLPIAATDEHWRNYVMSDYEGGKKKQEPDVKVYKEYVPEDAPLFHEEEKVWNED